MLDILSSAIRREKEIKDRKNGSKEIKLIFGDDMVEYGGNAKVSTKTTPETKYSGINLTKRAYAENYKLLIKKNEEDKNK